MSHFSEETYDIYDERFPRARKLHACHACKEPIQPGHRYARVFVLYDGDPETVIRCLRCQTVHEHLRQIGRESEMWPDERLNCGEEYFEHWGEHPPEEIAALAFASPEEVQASLGLTALGRWLGWMVRLTDAERASLEDLGCYYQGNASSYARELIHCAHQGTAPSAHAQLWFLRTYRPEPS